MKHYKSLIIGSFRKHYNQMVDIIDIFNKNAIEVLSPREAIIINPEDEFVVFDYDPKDLSDKEIEDKVLEKMHNVDFVYLYNPGGYIGLSASFEIGYCHAHGIKVYAFEESNELCFQYVDEVKKPHEVITLIKNSTGS